MIAAGPSLQMRARSLRRTAPSNCSGLYGVGVAILLSTVFRDPE